ncbi:hypothetical protein F5141DRAFT_1012766, partial [Pisolithus sp. B1]
TKGHHVSSVKPTSAMKTFHCLYTTALHSTSGVSFLGELHIYSPFNDVVLPNNTTGYVMVRAYFPPKASEEKILLEASHFFPLPGYPSSDAYELLIPNCLMPFALSLGTVPTHPSTLSNSTSCVFMVVVSDYVQDGRKSSSVQYICMVYVCVLHTDDPNFLLHRGVRARGKGQSTCLRFQLRLWSLGKGEG